MNVRPFVACAALACALAAAHAAPPADPPARGLIVKLKPAADAGGRESAQALRERTAGVAQRRGVGYRSLRATVLGAHVLHAERLLSGDEARVLAERLAADPDVEWVAENSLERPLALPNDPEYGKQWWLHGIASGGAAVPDFPAAWDVTTGSDDVVVAVLDSGIRRFHPEFTVGATRLLPGYDFVSETEYSNDGDGLDPHPDDPGDWGCTDGEDSTWHGTAIAGQIAAPTNDGNGIAGITWRGKLLPVRVAGRCGAAVSDIVEGMFWAAGIPYTGSPAPNPNPARIINLSFGGNPPCDVNHPTDTVRGTARLYTDTIAALRQKGVLLVAAAGNEQGNVVRPASCAGALAVTALTRSGAKASYANFGPQVGIATVGGRGTPLGDGIYTTTNTGRREPETDSYGYHEGTSFAAPIVSGAAALMLAVNPHLSVDQLIAGLKASARPHAAAGSAACSASNPGTCRCTTTTCGAGMLDAPAALAWAQATTGNLSPVTPCVTFRPDRLGGGTVPCSDGGSSGGGGGGGATGPGWLLALALAVGWLSAGRRRG